MKGNFFGFVKGGFSILPIRSDKCLGLGIDIRLGAKKMLNKILFKYY